MRLVEQIDFRAISSVPALLKDFLEGKWSAACLPTDENFSRLLAERTQNFASNKRQILYEVLSRQMSTLSLEASQKENLEKLAQEKCVTVTTGHQLNLFSGPVFFLYKIAQILQLSATLKKQFPSYECVPIFWMATEDHDFQEINHFYRGDQKYILEAEQGGPVGRIIIENNDFIDQFSNDVQMAAYGPELIKLLKKCYVPGRSLAEATRLLVHELFSTHGILILDGDEAVLKNEVKDVFKAELTASQLFHVTQPLVEKLTAAYGKVQVNPREVNLFYLGERRERIDKTTEGFILSETKKTFSLDEMVAELEAHPENFSPNALLRPVYQECILPNVAYVGGNAEIMYWLELEAYWKAFQTTPPLLVPRQSHLRITKSLVKRIEKENWQFLDFFTSPTDLLNAEIHAKSDLLPQMNALEKTLRHQLATMKNWMEVTHPSFAGMVKAEEARQLRSFSRLKKRLLQAEKKQYEEIAQKIKSISDALHPYGQWQERRENFSVWYAQQGPAWIEEMIAHTPAYFPGLLVFEE